MSNVTIITPPDILHNNNLSFLLVNPTNDTKQQLQNLIAHFTIPVNVYLYEPESQEDVNISWILNTSNAVDFCILDLDNMGYIEHNFASYLISKSNTFYLTNDEQTPYNLLSVNRIYSLDWLYEKLKEE